MNAINGLEYNVWLNIKKISVVINIQEFLFLFLNLRFSIASALKIVSLLIPHQSIWN